MINRSLAVAGMGLLASIASVNPIHADTVDTVIVECDTLNVRSGANTTFDIIGAVHKGDTLKVIESKYGWFKVQYTPTDTGWVSGKYSVKMGDGFTVAKNTAGDELNVRDGKGMSHDVKTTINKGDIVKIIDDEESWFEVETLSGEKGYAFGEFLEEADEEDVAFDIQGYGEVIKCNTLTIREDADKDAKAVRVVKDGTMFEITEEKGDFYKVRMLKGTEGWVLKDYVQASKTKEDYNKYAEKYKKKEVVKPKTVRRVAPKVVKTKVRYKTQKTQTQNKKPQKVQTQTQTQKPQKQESYAQAPSGNQTKTQQFVSIVKSKLGCPYVYGSAGPNRFDCSGLVYYAYHQVTGRYLNRSASTLANNGRYVSKSNLQAGDLVFFNGGSGRIKHVGIYVGNGKIIHAPSPGKSVKYENLYSSYYVKSYVTARRVF